MQIHYTQKLYFGKYWYKISVQAEGTSRTWWQAPVQVDQVVSWCMANLPSDQFKLTRRRQYHDDNQHTSVWHVCIYCAQENLKDQVLQQFGAQVMELCQPLDMAHRDNLSVKNIVQVRKTLIYKKFRHVVYFKYDRTGELNKWLHKYFKHNDQVRVSGHRWWSKVYMESDADVWSLQLSWPDQIDYVKTVRLLGEHE